MASETETHYVARVVFERVQKTSNTRHPSEAATVEREVIEMGSYTFKDNDLDNLKGRLNAVTALVEDF